MKREVLLDTLGEETRMLVLEDGIPVEFALERADAPRLVGGLYIARVINVLRGMEAAFVDIGAERNAFLSLDDLPAIARDADEVRVDIRDRKPLRPGQEVLVQVVKEPGGDKGPRVTMSPTFPGKYIVLLPTVEAIGVSRHIEDEEARRTLYDCAKAACPSGMGLIIRTAGADATALDIKQETETLLARWQEIEQAARVSKAPALLYDDGGLFARAYRDLNAPVATGPWNDPLEQKLEKALRRKVWLDSGAFLIIDRCEAMTVIDVNSGKFTGKKNLADTLLRLNCEAAREIARQIRLRDIGGIIIIDFVDMKAEEDRQAVLDTLCQAMEPDRAKYHIHGFTAAGLLEMTRRPVYQPVLNAMMEPCSACESAGYQLTPDAKAHRLLRQIRARRMGGDEDALTLTAPEPVLAALRRIGLPDSVEAHAGREEALR